MVDCEQQRSNDIPHLDDDLLGIYNRELDKDGKPVEDSDGETVKATSFCRKTLQTSKYYRDEKLFVLSLKDILLNSSDSINMSIV